MSNWKLYLSLIFACLLATNISAQSKASKKGSTIDFKKSLKQLKNRYVKNPKDLANLSKIGEAYYMINQMESAKEWFEKVIEISALPTEQVFQYAHTLTALKNYSAAKNWFLIYAEVEPQVGLHYANLMDLLPEMDKIAPIYSVNPSSVNTNEVEMSISMINERIYYLTKSIYGAKLHYAEWDKSKNSSVFKGELDTGMNLNEVVSFSFSSDRKKVIYCKQKSFYGQRQIPEAGISSEIFVANVRQDGIWTNSQEFPFAVENVNRQSPSFSNHDNDLIYFSSDRPDGFGGFDIYSSNLDNGSWSFPANLGSEINTPGNEIYPFRNNKSLYFSSNWHEGFGGYDVFRATMNKNENSKIYHQGKSINSSMDDLGFQYSQAMNRGFFFSNRKEGVGNEDIYSVKKATDGFTITIMDDTHANTIANALVDMSSCGGTKAYTNNSGQFNFQLNGNYECEIAISKAGFEKAKIMVGPSKGRSYTLGLQKASEKITGVVLDEKTGAVVPNVFVKAIERSSGRELKSKSDEKGQYTLAIKKNIEYQLFLERQGYQKTEKTIVIEDGQEETLGFINLSSSKKVFVPSKSEKISGYTVQIGAFGLGKNVELSDYSKLEDIGEVFLERGDDFNRLRVGKFTSKEFANEAKKQVSKRGFPSAYVVEQEIIISTPSKNETKGGIDSKSELYASETQDKSPIAEKEKEYKIRLVALREIKNFDYDIAQQFGIVESVKKDDFTIFFVAGIKDIDNARLYLKTLKNKGFEDAYLMEEINGEFKKMTR